MLVIRGAVPLQTRMRLLRQTRFHLLQQAGFANAGLAVAHHHLPHTVLDLLPALEQELHLLLPAHQRRESGGDGDLQAAARAALPQDLVGMHGRGDALECSTSEYHGKRTGHAAADTSWR